MNIFYSGYQYDYGDKKRGYSYEYCNLYKSLTLMDNKKHKVKNFRTDLFHELGRKDFNRKAIEAIRNKNFDIAFFVFFKDEFNDETLDYIKNKSKTISVGWMSDDHWRFETYGIKMAPHLNWIVTTDETSFYKYKESGFDNVILSQWAFNHFNYKPRNFKFRHDISFVGQPHSSRKFYINELKKLGYKIYCRGFGWPKGKISLNGMINVFYNSKINLNFTSSSFGKNIKSFIKIFLNKAKEGYKLNNMATIINNIKIFFKKDLNQIKARIFEIAGSKGFLLTENAKNIDKFYNLKNEIIIFKNFLDLEKKIKLYINNDRERRRIINNAYKKTLKYHTYENRFRNIFKKII